MAVASTLSLDRRLTTGEHVALKFGGMSTMKVYLAGVHQPVDVALGDRLRRLEIRRQECVAIRRDSSE